jgi:hypothetical protein
MSEVREKYVQRFADMLESLQSRLSELEQNLDSIKDNHPEKQKARLDVLSEINKTKENIENTKKNLEYSKAIPINRSGRVPANIPDHNVWNDCWYDEERNMYVTCCKYFQEIPGAKERTHQIQYTNETGNKGIIIVPTDVEFRFGYPSVIQSNSKGKDVWYLLSTLSNDMLTKEIVTARLNPKSIENAILYRTEAERWISIGTDGFSVCERENEISDELGIFPSVPIEELKTMYNRK